MKRIAHLAQLPTAAAVIAVVGFMTAPAYPGSVLYYLLFHAACSLVVIAAFLRPMSHGYSAFALFLVLGFWLKVVLSTIGIDPLIEPTGDFDWSGPAWDEALALSATGLAAVAAPKILLAVHLGGSRDTEVGVPSWFARAPRVVWSITFAVIIGSNLANWFGQLYMVGLHERVVLPFRLNVLISWWLTWGAGMWLALVLGWELRLATGRSRAVWLAPVGEALLTSTVMLSRGFYLMKLLPYVLVLGRTRLRERSAVNRGFVTTLGAISVAGFAATLVFVSLLRLEIYIELVLPTPNAVEATSGRTSGEKTDQKRPNASFSSDAEGRTVQLERMKGMAVQLGRMVAGRWIGLEGVLAVSASSERDMTFWWNAMREDPRAGTNGMYQRLAQAQYDSYPGTTFLTLPGVIAVMAYAGSHVVLAIAMLAISVLLLGTELAARRLFGNEFLCAVVGVAVAYTLTQVTFPYLTAVFFVELWGTILLLWIVSRSAKQRVVESATVAIRRP